MFYTWEIKTLPKWDENRILSLHHSKYITFFDERREQESIIVFPFFLVHRKIAESKIRNNLILGAGIIDIFTPSVIGESESLGIKSRQEDNILLLGLLENHELLKDSWLHHISQKEFK